MPELITPLTLADIGAILRDHPPEYEAAAILKALGELATHLPDALAGKNATWDGDVAVILHVFAQLSKAMGRAAHRVSDVTEDMAEDADSALWDAVAAQAFEASRSLHQARVCLDDASQKAAEGQTAAPATRFIEPDDPTEIDWTVRQARAAIPFEVVAGRPVNPCAPTGVPRGRGTLWAWGETLAADALVSATDARDGSRWILMVERGDGHGWAIPGGCVEPCEDPVAAAVRELQEETGLALPNGWESTPPRYVPDPRATDEAWMVTVLCTASIGCLPREEFPAVVGADDADRAAWILADTINALTSHLADIYGGKLFAAHTPMLTAVL